MVEKKFRAFDVFLNGKKIDTITMLVGPKDVLTSVAEGVRRGLVDHDGYNPDIAVRARRRRPDRWVPDTFTAAYVEAILFAETDESTPNGGYPLNKNFSIESFTKKALAIIRKDCETFQKLAGERMLEQGLGAAAYDFWLTRQGHGAGFWDGDWPEHGDALDGLAKLFQEQYIQVQRKKLHIYGGKVPTMSETPCDECGAYIPVVDGGGIENCWHLESCSLFDAQNK